MTAEERLTMLKRDLQRSTSTQDVYLMALLQQAQQAMLREGIIDDNTMDYDMAIVDYASFLFRKRNDPSMTMSRFLRYELNNLLFSQKTSEDNA
jgi:hypothetical protein